MTESLSNTSSLDILAKELKTARLGRNLSLEDVSQLTRIKKYYLEQLENGNFRFLPSGYVYACIKSYMREMGLNESEILDHCKKELKQLEAINSGSVTKITTDNKVGNTFWKNKIYRHSPELLKSIVPLTIGMVIGVIGAVGFSYTDNGSNVPVHPPTAASTSSSVHLSKTSLINTSGINQKKKSSTVQITPTLPTKPPPASVDTSVFSTAPLRVSGSQQ